LDIIVGTVMRKTNKI